MYMGAESYSLRYCGYSQVRKLLLRDLVPEAAGICCSMTSTMTAKEVRSYLLGTVYGYRGGGRRDAGSSCTSSLQERD